MGIPQGKGSLAACFIVGLLSILSEITEKSGPSAGRTRVGRSFGEGLKQVCCPRPTPNIVLPVLRAIWQL